MAPADRETVATDGQGEPTHLDAVVCGAGFGGLYALHKLRDQLELSVRVFEAADGVGGTWYWNRYPGCRCDIESYNYSYSFSEELQQEWEWSERFAGQPEILRYLEHVADRFDLRRDIRFGTRLVAAAYDQQAHRWLIEADSGERVSARFLVSAAGNLSAAKDPEYEGLESFAGRIYRTAHWPHEPVDFTGQRVGVIGTGASGIQVIPHVAAQAAHLTVFQRTPNYATPIGNGAMDPEFQRHIKANYPELRSRSRNHRLGVPYDKMRPSALEDEPQERRRVYQERWREGGFRLFFDAYADILFDQAANDTAAEFIREQIRERVDDPEVAAALSPSDHPYATKRPPLETDYYEAYNRDNVTLVDVRTTPIEEIVPAGVRTSERLHELNSLVLATGFDAMTGPLRRMGLTGRDGVSLDERWADGPHTYLGLAIHGFPNLFTITGPQSPSVLYNMPLAIEDHVDWIAGCIEHMREHGHSEVEATRPAEERWGQETKAIADATLMPRANSWYTGANVPGKPRVFLVYLGGAPAYRAICDAVISEGYQGFAFDGAVAETELTALEAQPA